MTVDSMSLRKRWPEKMYDRAWQCYSSLSVEDRQILLMSYVDALTGAEIACVLQMDEGEVVMRLIAARQQLRRALQETAASPLATPVIAGAAALPPSTAA